jgi:hypothetical protein
MGTHAKREKEMSIHSKLEAPTEKGAPKFIILL